MLTRSLCASLLITLLVASASPAVQRTFVSAEAGSDANPCTRLQPCRNFTAALPGTDVGGEIVALDSGGYGPVTLNKAVTLVAAPGVHAAITAFAGTAGVFVNANASSDIVIRNIALNSLGSGNGITAANASAARLLHIENCTIRGFGLNGIAVGLSPPGALHVSNTVVERCGGVGINASGRVSLDSVQLHKNVSAGFYFGTGVATVRDSVATGSDTGFHAGGNIYTGQVASMVVENSEASGNGIGFRCGSVTGAGTIFLTRSTAAHNQTGLQSDNGAIYVSETTIVENAVGLAHLSGMLVTRGNNTLQANTTNGGFTLTYDAE
jgi:hypothetical protein